MQFLFHSCNANARQALRHCPGVFARTLIALMLVVLSSCGGGSGSPSVALSNMVPVRLAMYLPGQPIAQIDHWSASPFANSSLVLGVNFTLGNDFSHNKNTQPGQARLVRGGF